MKDFIKNYKKFVDNVTVKNPSKDEIEQKLSELFEITKRCKEDTKELYLILAIYLTVYRTMCTQFK